MRETKPSAKTKATKGGAGIEYPTYNPKRISNEQQEGIFWLVCMTLFVVFLILRKRKRAPKLESHGTAEIADNAYLKRHGMYCKAPLCLGLYGSKPIYTDPVHTAVIAPTGAGKGQAVMIPFLLDSTDNNVVIDVTGGETYRATIKARRKHGAVYTFDPFGVVTSKSCSINPLSMIDTDNPIMDARAFAKAVIVPDPSGNNAKHFEQAAELFVSTMASFMALTAPDADRITMSTLTNILTDDKEVKAVCDLAVGMGGVIARSAYEMGNYVDKERAGVMTTTNQNLSALNVPDVMAVIDKTTVPLSRIKQSPMTIYVVIPPEYLAASITLIRIMLHTIMQACVKGEGKRLVYFHIDETAALGHMQLIEDALSQYRKFQVRLLLYYQNIEQMRLSFPREQHTAALSNCTQMIFAVNDYQTAEYVQKRIGNQTIVVDSYNSSRGDSTNWDIQGRATQSMNRNSGSNTSETGRAYLFADEVLRLPTRAAITFIQGKLPIMTWLVFAHERNQKPKRRKRMVMLLLVAAAMAFAFVGAIKRGI